MTSLFRKCRWWVQRRWKEEELREELQFHLDEEASERQADGLSEDRARWAARRDLGNVTLVREDTRSLWSWILLEQLAQDIRYGVRTMAANKTFSAMAILSLALESEPTPPSSASWIRSSCVRCLCPSRRPS